MDPFPPFEFTVEDMLLLHRDWISKLYVEDRKSPSEIVALLQDRRLFVSPSQVRCCIEEWDLVQAIPPVHPAPWNIPSSDSESEAPTSSSFNQSDPDLVMLYKKRPLPSLPNPKLGTKYSNAPQPQRRNRKSSTTLSSTTLNSIHSLCQLYELEVSLQSLPHQPSAMERYIGEEQAHERIAVGIERMQEMVDFQRSHWRRSGELRDGATSIRVFSGDRRRRRRRASGEEKREKRK